MQFPYSESFLSLLLTPRVIKLYSISYFSFLPSFPFFSLPPRFSDTPIMKRYQRVTKYSPRVLLVGKNEYIFNPAGSILHFYFHYFRFEGKSLDGRKAAERKHPAREWWRLRKIFEGHDWCPSNDETNDEYTRKKWKDKEKEGRKKKHFLRRGSRFLFFSSLSPFFFTRFVR